MPATNAVLNSNVDLAPAAVAQTAPVDLVQINVRFHPNATIWEIGERPQSLDREQWFAALCARVGDKYRTRAGGRGFFRVPREELEALKASALQ